MTSEFILRRQLASSWNMPVELALDLSALALYDIIIYAGAGHKIAVGVNFSLSTLPTVALATDVALAVDAIIFCVAASSCAVFGAMLCCAALQILQQVGLS